MVSFIHYLIRFEAFVLYHVNRYLSHLDWQTEDAQEEICHCQGCQKRVGWRLDFAISQGCHNYEEITDHTEENGQPEERIEFSEDIRKKDL